MNRKILTLTFIFLIFFQLLSFSNELNEDKKQYLLEKSYEILEFIYEDNNDFVREPLSVSLKKIKDSDYIFINYFSRNFQFEFFRGLINNFRAHDNTIVGEKKEPEYFVKRAREFVRKFRPDLDDIFLFPKVYRKRKEKIIFGYHYFYGGFHSTEWTSVEFRLDGVITYSNLYPRFDYKVPEKILSYDEAKEKVHEFMKKQLKKKKIYYGNIIEDYHIIELTPDQKERYVIFGMFRFDLSKPMFFHPNSLFGKYKNNLEKYGYTKEDFNLAIEAAKFVRLSYLIWVDKPLLDPVQKYTGLIVDAETGEIIGGM